MAKQVINNGVSVNDKSGDPIRTAFAKVNANFTEIYDALTDGVNFAQVNADWNATSGIAQVLNKPSIPTNTNQLTNGARFITSTPSLVNGLHTVSLGSTGILTLPSNSYLENTDVNLKIGAQGTVTICSDAVSNATTKEWVFDKSGTINTPLMLPVLFTATADSAHYVGEGSLTLTGDAWHFDVSFLVNPDGSVETHIENITAWFGNPGYVSGIEFEFTEADHGIPGYTCTLGLVDVYNPGGEMWTTNVTASLAPNYPSTINTSGAIKLTSNNKSWAFGTLGSLTVPGPIVQGFAKLEFNANNGTNVYITPTTDDSTAMFINTTSVQAYATESVGLQVGAGLAALELEWFNAEQVYADVRDQDAALIAPATRSWAGMPSYQAYDIIIGQIWDPAVLNALPMVANNAKTAYNNWQIALDNTSVGISVGNNGWAFNPNGSVQHPGDITQGYQDSTSCPAGADTVIYTATGQWQHAVKLFVMVEGTPDGGTSWETQACDIIAVRGYVDNIVHVNAYGVTYSSATAFATFDGQWNGTTNRIEITCRPNSATNSVVASVHAIEMTSND